MRSQLIISLLWLLLILGCREPYDIGGVEAGARKLVIDAIVTDSGKNGYVRVSYTSPFVYGRGVRYEEEDEAIVLVTDNDGNEFLFGSKGEGVYESSTFSAEAGKQYQLSVRVGESYFQSGWESLPLAEAAALATEFRPDTLEVLSVNGSISQELAVTISDQITKADQSLYYHWKLEHYYIYDAYGQPVTDLPGSHRFCYISDIPHTELLIHQDKAIDELSGNRYRVDISSVLFGNKMIYDYAVHVVRYNIPPEMFIYFENIRKQLENTGGFFDVSPSTIQGNLVRMAGDMEVLGFFGVFNESSTHMFFNQDELPFPKRSLPDNPAACPGHHNITLENNCFNCASVSATFNSTTKPSWWR